MLHLFQSFTGPQDGFDHLCERTLAERRSASLLYGGFSVPVASLMIVTIPVTPNVVSAIDRKDWFIRFLSWKRGSCSASYSRLAENNNQSRA